LKGRHGCRVFRIGLDAGFSCPNRDGTKGFGGCAYCNDDGSRASYADPDEPVRKQIETRLSYLKAARGAEKFIAYFQAFTNTHAAPERLKEVYDNVLPFDEIVGLSIGTRPDAIDREKLGLIASYADRREVWIEYGLQSVHDRTLRAINRGHDFADFLRAVEMTKDFSIKVCSHIILGLPGENAADMMETAKTVSRLKIDGVKIHLLHILKGSAFERLYNDGTIRVLGEDEYAGLVCDFLERLSPDIIIQRLTGEGPRKSHLAPLWALDKLGTITKIRETLKKRGSCQGSKYASRPG
jgi:radical SAM protein (TIGR01212 family)